MITGRLMTHQTTGVQFLMSRDRAILADDMGLGKTLQAIMVAEGRGGQTLVVCPNSVRYVWEDEVHKWTTDRTVCVLEGSSVERQKQLKTTEADYVVVNYESMRLIEVELGWRFFDMIVFDEAHRLKNRQSQTFKSAKRLTADTPYVIEMTGTPILNRPDDLWTLLHIVDRKQYRGYWKFVERYCKVTHNGFGWEVGRLLPDSTLADDVTPYLLRRTKDEVLDLPDKVTQDVWLEMDAVTAKAYKQMARDLLAEIGDTIVWAPSVLARLTRLRQIAVSPSLLMDVRDGDQVLTGAKAEALLDIVEGAGDEKIVVFTPYSTAVRQTQRLLETKKIASLSIVGDDSPQVRETRLNKFRSDPNVRVLLMTIGVGGIGITLTESSIVVFLNLDWSPGINTQAEDRLHRIGQTKSVTVYRLMYRKSIDATIEKMLRGKQFDADRAVPLESLITGDF